MLRHHVSHFPVAVPTQALSGDVDRSHASSCATCLHGFSLCAPLQPYFCDPLKVFDMSSVSAKVVVKQGSLAWQPKSVPLQRPRFSRSGVCCAWGSEARLLKEIQMVGQEVKDLRSDVRVLDARVKSAVVVNVGAYLAPVLGFVALANSFGFLDKLKN